VTPTRNELAFIALLSHSEGTDSAEDPYRVCYGYPQAWAHTIVSLAQHPACPSAAGDPAEWEGESLASLGPGYEHSISTAAGRCQINRPSWEEGAKALHLPDFEADSQNRWCIWCFGARGALDLINSGNIEPAIGRLRGTWASLPGGHSGQPEAKLADLVEVYSGAGGALA
jgi:muramidase (phage lysozyme)